MQKKLYNKILIFLLVFAVVFSNFPVNIITDYLAEKNIVDNIYWASKVSNVVDNFGVKNVYAADGSGTNIVSPTSAVSNTAGNTFNFTFTAAETMDSGVFRIAVPAGWSAPQLAPGVAGYTTTASSSGMVADVLTTADALAGGTGTWLEDDADACNSVNIRTSTTIFKEGTASVECNNAASAAADNSDSFAYRYAGTSNWSSYTKIAAWVYVTKAMNATNYIRLAYDDTSGMTSPLQALNLTTIPASTWTYVTMNLTAARTAVKEFGIVCVNAGCDNDVVYVDYFLIGPGKPIITGTGPWGVNVALMNLSAGQTVSVVYGAGGGASGVVTPTVAVDTPYTFTTASRISTNGTFTNIATSPVITVTKPAGPDADSYTNDTEGTLTDGGRSGQQITVTGTNFGAGPSDGTNYAVKIGTYTVPDVNVVWGPTSIIFTLPSGGAVYGGTGTNGLIIRAGGVDDATPLDFYIYPNITNISANSGQIGSIITISGDHFGSAAGTVTINTKTATVVGPWSSTSLDLRIPGQEGIANINGKIQLTRSDTRTSNQYPVNPSDFTILAPSISGSNPTSATTGQTLTIEFSGLGIDTDAGTAPLLKLTKTGETTIDGSSYSKITDYQTVSASFNLSGAVTGWWKLVVINMDGQLGSYGDEATYGFYIGAPAPTVTGINPGFGTNAGTVNVASITGTNFQNGATAKLTKTSQSDITPSAAFTYTNSTTLSNGAFDLAGKAIGWWNVVVTNPDAQSASYGNEINSGFEIRSAKPSNPANIYQFKDSSDTAQPPTTNIVVGGGIGGQTDIYFRMDMSGGLTGVPYYPQVEVKPIGTAFECTNASPSPCSVTSGFFAEGSGVVYNGTTVKGWVNVAAVDGALYHWQARVRNSDGTSDWVSFGGNTDPNDRDVYVDNTVPTISLGTDDTCNTAAVNITDLGAAIIWSTTDVTSGAEPPPGNGQYATSQVQYIKTSQFTNWSSTPGTLTALDPRENSPHQMVLTGLAPSASYTYRIRSKDAVNNEALSANCTFTTTSTRPLKTVEFFIDQETAQNTGTEIVKSFSIYIPESPATDISVKSAYIEVNGITSDTAGQTVNIGLLRGDQAVGPAGANFTIDSTGTTTPFAIFFDTLNPPGAGQENMTDITTGASTYNYTLFLNGNGTAISTFSAKLIITYSYVL